MPVNAAKIDNAKSWVVAKLWQLPLAVLYLSLVGLRPELTCDAGITETGPHHGIAQPHGAAPPY